MAVILNDRVLVSEPHEVLFAGWRATTKSLAADGWDITVERCNYTDGIRLLLRHEHSRLYAVTHPVRPERLGRDFSGALLQARHEYEPFIVSQIGSQPNWRIREPIDVSACVPIDARTQWIDRTEWDAAWKTWDSLPIFASAFPEEKEIIVDPADVQFWLDKIVEAQAPRQKELREKARQAETRRQIHAQVVSLAA